MSAQEALTRSKRLIQNIQDEQLKEKILEVLPQGHGSGLDADLLDGLHAAEILAKMRVSSGGGGRSITDHGALTGLDDPADHAWAFLLDGSREMAGTIYVKDVLPASGWGVKLGSWQPTTELNEINVNSAYVGTLYPLRQTDYSGVWIHGSFYPAHDLTFDLGLLANRWLKGYIQTIYASVINEMTTDAGVTVEGVLCKDGIVTPTNGASGSFTTADEKTVTVTNGIITSIV